MDLAIPSKDSIIAILREIRGQNQSNPINGSNTDKRVNVNTESTVRETSEGWTSDLKTVNSETRQDDVSTKSEGLELVNNQLVNQRSGADEGSNRSIYSESRTVNSREIQRRERAQIVPGGLVRFILPPGEDTWLIEGYGIREGQPTVAVRYSGKERAVVPRRIVHKESDGYVLATYVKAKYLER